MRNRGFTLIEVLIALVIFVVGALAVIRIFPPAYNVVQNSGYSTVAARLSDSILAQMKGEESTPEAVFDIDDGAANWATDPVESNWQDQDGAVVGTSDTNGSLPSGLTGSAYDASALGHFRFIRGEKHEVQVASVTDPISGSVTKEPYILTNFPYEVNSGVRAYIELAISDVTVDNTGLLDFTHATYTDPVSGVKTSFHDSGNANRPPATITIAGASLKTRSEIPQGAGSLVNSGTRYYVSYQWRYTGAANPAGNTVINEPMGIPDNTSTSWSGTDTMRVVQGAIINNETTKDRSVIAGPVPVKVRINLGIDSDGDIINFPNYFPPASPSPFTAVDRQQWAYLGYVPILDDPADVSPHTLPANLPVYVDYLVPDWSTIYDQSVSDNSGAVSLPISLLDPNASIIGLWIDPTDQQLPKAIAGSIPTDKKGQVDYSNASAHIRTAYKGLDQWARQISPSAENYIPYVDVSGYTNVPGYRGVYSSTGNNPVTTSYFSPAAGMSLLPREPWREYFWTSGSSNIIYFHASEAGKSVQVSFVSTSGKTINNQLLTIDKAITEANLPADFVPVRDTNNTNLGYVSRLVLPTNANSILGVKGAGIIARTAWLNGNRFQQSVVTGYRTANAD